MAAKGAANLGTLRGGSAGASRIRSAKPTGSMAGYSGGRSAYIQPNSSGYGTMERQAKGLPAQPISSVGQPFMSNGNLQIRKPSRLPPKQIDRELARLIR